jgi:hypothetical protein
VHCTDVGFKELGSKVQVDVDGLHSPHGSYKHFHTLPDSKHFSPSLQAGGHSAEVPEQYLGMPQVDYSRGNKQTWINSSFNQIRDSVITLRTNVSDPH